ncbi:MAG: helicase-exonuclease AddAB subunit AddA [Ruminococcaceae bacterium]|nr:helicase-exonuclease AddAB subunit AddA [Oscillospiraceae bacterium]
MEFTPSQKEAITYCGENILLSAAAGSGKTAVLVQRVIEKILNEDNPVSINELLILTYTEAAASEMRRKIAKAINAEFAKNPTSEHLKRQKILINSANISTIHSFCLEVIKANINHTDIPIDFSIVSPIENTIMMENSLDEIMSLFYENMERVPSFKELVLSYGADKNDRSFRDIILKLITFAGSMAHPVKWLNEAVLTYKVKDFYSSVWYDRLFDYGEKAISDIMEVYGEIRNITEKNLPAEHPYNLFFTNEAEEVSNIAEAIFERSFDKVRDKFLDFEFLSLPRKQTKEPNEKIEQENIKSFRNLAKDMFKDLKTFFISDKEQVLFQLKSNEPQLRTLKNIAIMTMRNHKRAKRMAGYLDFNDLEHEVINLLENKGGKPSAVALSLKKKYREILVDEYQDTNNAQDRIFYLASRDNTNIFTVGDVKQCIYKFRNAVPEIFSEKSKKYRENQGGHLITLAKNFRSRHEILDLTNFVFEKIMTEKSCGIDYGKAERLEFGAEYFLPPQREDEFIPEFNIVDAREAEDTSSAEARAVAKRVRKMVEDREMLITDPKTGERRNIRYSDVVILMRNTKSSAGIFEKALSLQGIPVYSDTGQSYLTSVEVQTVLSYLQIIDNPFQDIPLIAIMRSPMWRFTPDMLAKIRSSSSRKIPFYSAVLKAAENGDVSCARFINDLESLRDQVEYSKVSDFVLTILNQYNYREIVLGEEDGQIKAENLRLLFERAAEYDNTPNSSLMGFMIYIQTIMDADQDLTPAKLDGESSDSVRILSIHKSKGLEYPVVILANVFARFNTDDTSKSILWHEDFGFGVPYTDTKRRIKYPSIPYKLISKTLRRELMAEEMRILYVGMTRAKEKLIVSAVVKKATSSWASPYLAQDKILNAGILKASSIGDWISYALARHKSAEALSNEHKLYYNLTEGDMGLVKVSFTGFDEEEAESEVVTEQALAIKEMYDESLMDKLKNRYSEACLPIKMSVSEAKRRQSEEEIYSPHIFTVPMISSSDISMLSATDKGTITHFVLQHIDFAKTNSEDEIQGEIQAMTERGIISSVQGSSVDIEKIFEFFRSDVGIRLKNAKEVHKEFSFYSEADAGDFYPEQRGNDKKILLQGTMDCFFVEEDGNVVLLDYKTDKVSEETIWSRADKYRYQLFAYKNGLESILKKPIKDAYICFLSCGKNIKIDEFKK